MLRVACCGFCSAAAAAKEALIGALEARLTEVRCCEGRLLWVLFCCCCR